MEKVYAHTAHHTLRHRSLWRRVVDAVLAADARNRQGHAYRNLPEHLRRDIGELPREAWDGPTVMTSKTLW